MHSPIQILVVDDEDDVREYLTTRLQSEGYEVAGADNAETALVLLEKTKPHILVVDWVMPGRSGLELCNEVRKQSDKFNPFLQILMVTALVDPSNIVQGLEAGADDYITKPFQLAVLLARVQTLARRALNIEKHLSKMMVVGELSIDVENQKVLCGSIPVVLTPSEFKLLLALLKHHGKVLTREQLMQVVQGEGINVVPRAIDTHVSVLRKKLGSCADLVKTVHGIGYRIKMIE